jgi:hypothetical protein
MAQENYKTTHKMQGSHISVGEDSSVLECDTAWWPSWCGLMPSSSESSILRTMLVSWTQWHWRWHYNPSRTVYFSSNSTMSHHRLLESSTELLPPLLFCITSQWVKALTNDSKHNYLLIKQTIRFECSPLCPHIEHNWTSHTHLHWTVSTFVRANVGARMFTR